jgi:diguanylate cyclase
LSAASVQSEELTVLEFPEGMPQATTYLKTTLPQLTKLALAPSPINYGLWYVHASGRRPELSAILDRVAQGQEPYDEAIARVLFETHVCLKGADVAGKAAAKFHLLTTMLQEHLRQSIDGSARMDKSIQSSRQSLQGAIDINDVQKTVSTVVELLDSFSETNRECRRTMEQAEEEIDRLRAELERAQQGANVDELTRLYNRATFYRELKRKIQRSSDMPKLCVVLCDLDHFKTINDRFGHLTGDRVLQRVGALLLEQSREGTLAARYGGEEFALIVSDADLDGATLFAERLRNSIQQTRIKIRNSDTVLERLTASFGVASYRDNDTAESLFERADRALYLAKEYGRNITVTEKSV